MPFFRTNAWKCFSQTRTIIPFIILSYSYSDFRDTEFNFKSLTYITDQINVNLYYISIKTNPRFAAITVFEI